MAETKGVVKIDDPKQLEINNWKGFVEKWRLISLKLIPYGFVAFFVALFLPFKYAALLIFLSVLPVVSWYASHSFKEVKKWERMLIFRKGDIHANRVPGWWLTAWPKDRTVFVKTYERRIDTPPQKFFIEEPIQLRPGSNAEPRQISITVDSMLWFKIKDAEKAVTAVEDVYGATKDIFMITLRDECTQYSIKTLLGEKEEINKKIKALMNEQTEEWGIEVTRAGIQEVILPPKIEESLNRVLEASKNREAKIIDADAESQRVEIVYRKIKLEDPEYTLRSLETIERFGEGKGSPIIFGGLKQFLKELLGKEDKK